MELKPEDKLARLEACRYTRSAAAQSCLYTLHQVLAQKSKVSELKFKNIWYKKMYQQKNIISEGWYDPPPEGLAVLFGDGQNHRRFDYPTLRPKEYWPRGNAYLKKMGLGYLFCSPYIFVDNIPIIGDFGFSFYLGDDQRIRDHYKKCYQVARDLFALIQIGMEYRRLYQKALELFDSYDLRNTTTSITDKTGVDIGHSIPFTERNPTAREMNLINSGESKLIHAVINKARRFINSEETFTISDNAAFTLEPRLIDQSDNSIPMYSLHAIIQFVRGEKRILGYHTGIINLLKMNWLIN